MNSFDLCLPWYSEYDADFVCLIQRACEVQNISLWPVTPRNLLESITSLYRGEIRFKTLLDRGQGDARFLPINRWARENKACRLNPDEVSDRASDKATMHLEFITGGVDTPYTIILSSFLDQPILREIDLTPLGPYFFMKPVMGGGGEGVVKLATLEEITRARLEFPEQKYILQANVDPTNFDGRPAWFRVFYAGGEIWPCWWHPATHVYGILSMEEENRYGLGRLREVTQRIASICRLDWFTTEIAVTAGGKFISVDYVNDQIDLRLQSRAMDGVPDAIIEKLSMRLAAMARSSAC
jgi:glutathione synthase/RimK-type ligase-like ATP-grasp enzyme